MVGRLPRSGPLPVRRAGRRGYGAQARLPRAHRAGRSGNIPRLQGAPPWLSTHHYLLYRWTEDYIAPAGADRFFVYTSSGGRWPARCDPEVEERRTLVGDFRPKCSKAGRLLVGDPLHLAPHWESPANTLCRQIRGRANSVRTVHETRNSSYFAGLRGLRAGRFSMFVLSTFEWGGTRNRPSRDGLSGCANTFNPTN